MKTQLLVVDDSETYRSYLRQVLSQDSDIEIVSFASNGRLALPRVKYYKPDVILLDQNMPEMDGLTAIPEIKKISPHSRIIMLSAETARDAGLTLRALSLGADDFITKPLNSDSAVFKTQLIDRIHALANANTPVVSKIPKPADVPTVAARSFRYCLIGVSTGGPTALRRMLKKIPDTIRGSILIVQHMPPVFTAQLAQSLDSESPLKVVEAQDGMEPEPGTVYIAPGSKQMKLIGGDSGHQISIEESDPAELCKPSANILFHSAAELCPEQVLAIIMTGMGDDGYLGMKALSARGAYLMAQEASDCVVYGMPAKPVNEGIVHEILTAEQLGERIKEYLS